MERRERDHFDWVSLSRLQVAQRGLTNVNVISIGYALTLWPKEPADPAQMNFEAGNLSLTAGKSFTSFTLLMSTFSLPAPPTAFAIRLLRGRDALLPCDVMGRTSGFGAKLSPVTSSVRKSIDR